MKTTLFLVIPSLLAVSAQAEFKNWTNKSGKVAELDLVEVTVEDGETVGKFKMRNGGMAMIKKSDLSEESAGELESWTPPMKGDSSVFDDILWGNLVKLEGDGFQKAVIAEKPREYYVFYYTASWCGPCRNFTPTLVEWYNENKNENFELILISSDRNPEAMESYAKKNQMLWPQLAFDKVREFKDAFRAKHGVRGIPTLIVCDPKGEVLGNFRSRLPQLSKMVKN